MRLLINEVIQSFEHTKSHIDVGAVENSMCKTVIRCVVLKFKFNIIQHFNNYLDFISAVRIIKF